MKSLVKKDKFSRIYIKHESILLDSISDNLSQFFIEKKRSINSIQNRCTFNNSSKTVFKRFRMSRYYLRIALLKKQVPFVVKK
uniref:Ribosomal protein S14 n=1 Tax=Thraustochytrium aureum TaxID=42467 RepID=Q9G4D6_9STRA|nr:ribosomal protein S14 [Thraustochytrium aureum]